MEEWLAIFRKFRRSHRHRSERDHKTQALRPGRNQTRDIQHDCNEQTLCTVPRLKVWKGLVVIGAICRPFFGWNVLAADLKPNQIEHL
jgi:hypothetical protein